MFRRYLDIRFTFLYPNSWILWLWLPFLLSCLQKKNDPRHFFLPKKNDTLIIDRDALIFFLPSDSIRLSSLQRSFDLKQVPGWQNFETDARKFMSDSRLKDIYMQFSTSKKLMILGSIYHVPDSSCCALVRFRQAPVFISPDSLQILSAQGIKDFFSSVIR